MPSLEDWRWGLKIFCGTNSNHPCICTYIISHVCTYTCTYMLNSCSQAERTARVNKMKLEAVVILQAHWRGHRVRKQYKDHLDAVRFRRVQQRSRAAHLLQAMWRGFVVRKIFGPKLEARREKRRELERKRAMQVERAKNRSAVKVQAHWRGYRARCIYGPILSALREKRIEEKARRQTEAERMYHHRATVLQAIWRGRVIRKRYGPVLSSRREERMREKVRKRHRAATSIQACWRGHWVRQRIMPQLLAGRSEQNRQTTPVEGAQIDEIIKDPSHSLKGVQAKVLIKQETSSTIVGGSQGQNPSRGSRKLTVTKRIQSALRLQEERRRTAPETSDAGNLNCTLERMGCDLTCQVDGSGSEEEEKEEEKEEEEEEEEEEKEEAGVRVQEVAEEQKAMTSLIASRKREEGLAQQSRIRMSMVMTHWDAEKVNSYHI